jgi:hypothetical protein
VLKKILFHIYSYYYVHINYTKSYTNIWCLCVHCDYDLIVINLFNYVLTGNLKEEKVRIVHTLIHPPPIEALFDGTDYSSWRENMKQFLKSKGSEVWNSVVSNPWDLTTSKNLSKITVQRRERKNNEVTLKILLNGLSDTVKERIGLCTSAKDLWLKSEKMYKIKNEDTEDIPIKDEDEDSGHQ